jgi:hypothetical protein
VRTVLVRMLERVLAARTRCEIVVATTDRPEDDGLAELVRRFGVRVFCGHPTDLADVLALLEERPELRETNARYAGVNWYRHHLSELRTVPAAATRFSAEDAPPRPPVEVQA